jgi:hypothetical protein
MNRSHFIFEFIDGALDSTSEQELFNELAQHPELRSELRHYISIGDAVRADREAYMPPAAIEHSLMTGLGLAPIASVGGGASAATGLFARVAFLKSFPIVASFVLGALLAGGSVFVALSDDATPTSALGGRDTIYVTHPNASPSVASVLPQIVQSAPRPDAPVQASRARSSERVAAPSVPIDWTRTTESPVSKSPSRELTVAESNDDPLRAIASVEARPLAPTDASPLTADHDGADDLALRGSALRPSSIESMLASDPGKGFIEVRRGALMRPYVDNAAREETPKFSDELSGALFVRTDDVMSIGFEVGQGRYTQVLVLPDNYVYKGQDMSNVARIEQEPNVTWFGVGGRFELGELINGLWAQGTVGYGVNNGPMFNTRVGLSQEIATSVSLTGAIETSTLVYSFEGQNLLTGKYGLTVGLQYGW